MQIGIRKYVLSYITYAWIRHSSTVSTSTRSNYEKSNQVTAVQYVQAKYHGSCDMAMENGTAVWRLRLRYAISGCRASYRSTNSAQTIQVAPCGLQLYPCIVSCCRKQISGCCNVVARLLALLLIQDAHSPCSSCTVL